MTIYNEKLQYRCTIIRGKSKNDLDSLLSKYATIIQEICPCSKEDFKKQFNEKLSKILNSSKKTLDNHRTEIAGKLFGMFYTDVNETVYPSERTLRFLNSQDQPEFFKDICSRFQFPNGMDSTATLVKRVNDNISFKPFAFILEVLSIADKKGFNISKNEVAYFILNSLQVLQSKIQPDDVVNKIIVYRNNDIKVKVQTQGKETSYSMQHITEQLNLLELANLIRIEKGILFLNPLEKKAITYIRSLLNKKLAFDFLNYDLKCILLFHFESILNFQYI